ncbi:MAG: LacI family DNA-binding transcriptional regulator [Cyclobacteriaceae bacterium]
MKTEKEITIYDIAEALNISAATVSRGLKGHPAIRLETRQKIAEAAERMGYQQNIFASNLRRKQTFTIGIVVPRLNSYFMSAVIAGMEKVANTEGYQLIISQSQESVRKEAANVQTMFNSRVDGLMVSLSAETENLQHFDLPRKKGIPLIFFDRVAEVPGSSSIVIDNVQASYEVTRYLIKQGRRRILYLGGNIKSAVYTGRLKGYRLALEEAKLLYDPTLVLSTDLSDQAGIETATYMLKLPQQPDGIFAANDTSAVACMSELKRTGLRVPEDVAVVGFNDDPISRVVDPQLTTVHYPGQEMGERAARQLIQKLRNPAESLAAKTVLPHQLIIRASSQKIMSNS